jgi:hypothetical protein
MAGSISLSLSQQFDILGKPLNGGLLQFYAAGTTNPQSAYQDVALTIPYPNPITLDGFGRVPPFYLADGQIKIRLSDKFGVLQLAADNLLVIGPSSGSGSPPSVDPTTLMQTGQVVPFYATGPILGFVRANGRTVGNASSGASERANADTQNLFTFLYQQDTSLVVAPGGRGASATADYAANKTIVLPDFRSRALAGLGDMGNADNALLSGVTFTSGNSTTLGSSLGAARRTLLTANLPAYTPTGTIASSFSSSLFAGTFSGGAGSAGNSFPQNATPLTGSVTSTFTGTAQGGTSAPLDAISPSALITIYLKI